MFVRIFEYWEKPDFSQYCLSELNRLQVEELPLQDCCQYSCVIEPKSLSFRLISQQKVSEYLLIKVGVFFQEVLSGCACSDDPSQAMIHENNYCELELRVEKDGAFSFRTCAF